MRKIFIMLATSLMLTSLSACFDDHSHDDGAHSHNGTPQHHDSIN